MNISYQDTLYLTGYGPWTSFYMDVVNVFGGLLKKNLTRDPLEIQHPKFENSKSGVIECVH